MAIQNTLDLTPFPNIPYGFNGNTLTQAFLLDATSEKFACIFRIPKTGTIDNVWATVGTVTTGGNIDFRLETVSTTTGHPTGTLIAAGANHVQNVTATGGQLVVLDTGPSVTRNDVVALVMNSTASADLTFLAGQDQTSQFPYVALNTASTWSSSPRMPCCALEYSDTSVPIIAGVNPIESAANVFFTSGSTPDEWAVRFKFPIDFRVWGFYIDAAAGTQAANTAFNLYDSDGSTILEGVTPDFDIQSSSNESQGFHQFPFDDDVTLTADTFYRFAMTAGANTAALTKMEYDATNTQIFDASPGGDSVHASSRVNAGAWTNLTETMLPFGLLINGVDLAAGGAGGIAKLIGQGGGLIG